MRKNNNNKNHHHHVNDKSNKDTQQNSQLETNMNNSNNNNSNKQKWLCISMKLYHWGLLLLIILECISLNRESIFLKHTQKGIDHISQTSYQTENDHNKQNNKNSSSLQFSNPSRPIPLADLVRDENSTKTIEEVCQGLPYMHDVVIIPKQYNMNDTNSTKFINKQSNNIPPIIHVTGKSRCVSNKFYQNLQLWKVPNFEFYFHDDNAVHALLNQYYYEFPHLQLVQPCIISGTAMADLWRYVVIYEYGGIYTDIDNAPGPSLKNFTTTLFQQSDAYFLQERGGYPSQYFFAATPKHPILYMAIQCTIQRLLELKNVADQYIPFVTGPGAMKQAFVWTIGTGTPTEGIYHIQGINNNNNHHGDKNNHNNSRHEEYHNNNNNYYYYGNRSVTIVGTKTTNTKYVLRAHLHGGEKRYGYKKMNMTHFSQQVTEPKHNASCYNQIYQAQLQVQQKNDGRLQFY